MTKKMMALAGLAVFVLALALTASAQKGASVAGSWDLTQPGRDGAPNTMMMTIMQDGNNLTGTIMGGRGGPVPLKGTIDGNNIDFSVTRAGRNGDVTQEYKGTVSGDSMTGMVTVGQNNVQWTAKRSAK